MSEPDDITLLRQYVDDDSEEAFAMLVARHINKVFSVALRFTRNLAQAEEITQAVFVIFAQKAHRLGKNVVLAGWLYQTARLTAMTFVRNEGRRFRREQEVYMRNEVEGTERDLWLQISPMLDAAMATLGETDRRAILLRFFDGKSLKEVGEMLGVQEDAAKKRLYRAVGKLRHFFAKRQVLVPTMTIETVIISNAVQSAPAGLAKSISAMALTKGAAISGSTTPLIKGALKLMAWTKMKTAVFAGVAMMVAAGGSTIAIQKFGHPPKPPDAALSQFEQTPAGALALNAVKFIMFLKLKGNLPGIMINTGIGIEIPLVTFDRPGGTPHFLKTNINYPLSLTITVHANTLNLYHYTIAKDSETSQWQLQKAWQSDTNGTVVQEFHLPQNPQNK